MSKICRLCLAESVTFYPLFRYDEIETQTIPLSMQVTMCTGVSISKGDNLPKRICINCNNFIREWYIFRRKCRESALSLNAASFDVPSKKDIVSEQSSDHVHDIVTDAMLLQENDPDLIEQTCTIVESETTIAEPWTGSQRHKCKHCPDSFAYLRDLNLHNVNVHSMGKRNVTKLKKKEAPRESKQRFYWRCCDQVFIAKCYFRHHIRKFHPGQKPFSCDECGKKDFISEETLRRHKMLHSGRYSCDICGKAFTCHAILRIHERDKHENDRPFVCDVCGKAFVTELLLSYHQRFHTGEKKYVCEVCGVAVVTSSSLAKHRRIHSKIKPHVCDMCGKGFIVRARLVEHIRIHTGERPFSCDICGKGFTMHDKLKRHKKTHTDQKPFRCDMCENAYSTNHGLCVHRKAHITGQQVTTYLLKFLF